MPEIFTGYARPMMMPKLLPTLDEYAVIRFFSSEAFHAIFSPIFSYMKCINLHHKLLTKDVFISGVVILTTSISTQRTLYSF